jgi:hypothetical protein
MWTLSAEQPSPGRAEASVAQPVRGDPVVSQCRGAECPCSLSSAAWSAAGEECPFGGWSMLRRHVPEFCVPRAPTARTSRRTEAGPVSSTPTLRASSRPAVKAVGHEATATRGCSLPHLRTCRRSAVTGLEHAAPAALACSTPTLRSSSRSAGDSLGCGPPAAVGRCIQKVHSFSRSAVKAFEQQMPGVRGCNTPTLRASSTPTVKALEQEVPAAVGCSMPTLRSFSRSAVDSMLHFAVATCRVPTVLDKLLHLGGRGVRVGEAANPGPATVVIANVTSLKRA